MNRLRDRRGTDVNLRPAPQTREYETNPVCIGPRPILDWGWSRIAKLLLSGPGSFDAVFTPGVPELLGTSPA
jgi:hypothetical protein